MGLENNRIPTDAEQWHPEEEEVRPQSAPITIETKPQTIEMPPAENLPAVAAENFKPTAKNPIEKVTVGLWQTLGHFETPTRIILTLKDGKTAEMPWEQAEPLMPAEFKTAREMGTQARKLEKQATDIADSIRGATDVMQRSGHIKDAMLKPMGMERPAHQYLNAAADLALELDAIAQESFIELRQMADISKDYQNQIPQLSSRLDAARRQLEDIRAKAFEKMPEVQKLHEKLYERPREKQNSLGKKASPELPEPK